MREVGQKGIAPCLLVDAIADVTVEVAIGAFRKTKRPMHIDAETGIGGF
jgi:hypothetical protein